VARASLNTWAWSLGDDPQVARISRVVRSPIGRFLYLVLNASARWLLPASFARGNRLGREEHKQYLAPFAKRSERRAPWVLGCELAGSADWYANIWRRRKLLADKNWTFIWGEEDPTFALRHLERWRAAFPHCTTKRLPSVGHFPQEEAADLVTLEIARASQ
jgi:pimeloyl-ACP methyl ester carboxylesterase